MISLSRLYGGDAGVSDALRYGTAGERPGPVVVWNLTRSCNLRCAHCYADARTNDSPPGGPSFEEGCRLLDDLAGFGVPAVLLSGGEPLLHPHVFDFIRHAARRGLRVALSTNGTLLDAATARRLHDAGAAYVGISLDGLSGTHDRFRGVSGAFDAALRGLRAGRDAGLRVGIRCVMTRAGITDIPDLIALAHSEGVPRMCFYHWVPSGRAQTGDDASPDAAETRHALNALQAAARVDAASRREMELLTVDNHADGPYTILCLAKEDSAAAAAALRLLRRNGGNGSGSRIACVGWDGAVYTDQFWRTRPVGHIRQRPFSAIWTDPAQPLLAALRDRKRRLKGRCGACRWLDICNGNLRARAEALTGDPWAFDPACYLTDEEIGEEGWRKVEG